MVNTVTATAITYEQKAKYARIVLGAFVNEMIDSFGDKWFLNLKDTEKRALEKDSMYIDILGNTFYQWSINGMSTRRMNEAVERVVTRLEDENSATIPPVAYFIKGMQDEMTEFDFALISDAGHDIFKDIIDTGNKVNKGVVDVVGSVGSSVGSAVKNLGEAVESTTESAISITKMLPAVIAGLAVAIIVFAFKFGSKKAMSISK